MRILRVSLLFTFANALWADHCLSQANLTYLVKTGNDLVEVCHWDAGRSIPDGAKNLYFGMCTGYLSGVIDTESLTHTALEAVKISDTRQLRFCASDSRITNGQLEAAVKSFSIAHPELLHLSASALVTGALSHSFPCSK